MIYKDGMSFPGQRMLHNSSTEDTPRVKYMEAYIEGVLNALRYAFYVLDLSNLDDTICEITKSLVA